jgi:glycosyltransferase involved in cell wall biosynthesis
MQPVPSSTIKKLTVIIPCYNEEQYVEKVLQRLMEVNLDHTLQKEIIIVNDGSLDETQLKIEKFISQHPLADISLLNHEINKGKGSCIKTA